MMTRKQKLAASIAESNYSELEVEEFSIEDMRNEIDSFDINYQNDYDLYNQQ